MRNKKLAFFILLLLLFLLPQTVFAQAPEDEPGGEGEGDLDIVIDYIGGGSGMSLIITHSFGIPLFTRKENEKSEAIRSYKQQKSQELQNEVFAAPREEASPTSLTAQVLERAREANLFSAARPYTGTGSRSDTKSGPWLEISLFAASILAGFALARILHVRKKRSRTDAY